MTDNWLGALGQKRPDNGQRGEYRPGPASGGTAYAQRALESECRNVAEAAEGTRNDTLNRAAFAVFQLVAGGELSEADAWAELREAGRASGLSEHEVDATIASGASAGKERPRQAPPRPERRPSTGRREDSTPDPNVPEAMDDSGTSGETPGEPESGTQCAEQRKPALQRYRFLSMAELLAQVVALLDSQRPRAGVSTGNAEVDEAMGGFRPGNITVFGARRGFGKTTYGNFIKVLGEQQGYRIIVIAGEDPAIMYGKRFMAALATVNALLLRDNRCKKDDWPRIVAAQAGASRKPFFWRTDGAPVELVARVIRDVGAEEQIDLVIVDYLQCIRARQQFDRRNEVTFVMGQLCDAIRAINSAGLIFSQLRRADVIEPDIEHLKESGDIEDKADHVLLGWKVNEGREDAPDIRRYIKLAKNKDGTEAEELRKQDQAWDRKTASFRFTGRPTSMKEPDEFSDLDAPPPNYQDTDNDAIDGRYP